MTRPDVKVAIKLEKSTGARATFDPTIKLCGSREACDSTSALGEGERGGARSGGGALYNTGRAEGHSALRNYQHALVTRKRGLELI